MQKNNTGIFITDLSTHERIIVLTPTENERAKVRVLVRDAIYLWLQKHNVPFPENAYTMFFLEAWKNIFDHAGNLGYIKIIWKENIFSFVMLDYGVKQLPLSKLYISENSTKAGNDVNFGVGMKMIREMGNSMFDNFLTTATFGIKYSGSKNFKPLQ